MGVADKVFRGGGGGVFGVGGGVCLVWEGEGRGGGEDLGFRNIIKYE